MRADDVDASFFKTSADPVYGLTSAANFTFLLYFSMVESCEMSWVGLIDSLRYVVSGLSSGKEQIA